VSQSVTVNSTPIAVSVNDTPPISVLVPSTSVSIVVTNGKDGQGVPIGGTAGQVLAKIDDTNYNTHWVTGGGGGAVASVNGQTGIVVLAKADIGLGNVDNTSDANKPISSATQSALNLKADTASLATVATTGSYTDLTNKPSIPTKAYISGVAAAMTMGAF